MILGLHVNKLFSYSIDTNDLFIFDTEERLWDVAENVMFDYKPNSKHRLLNHSM